MFARLKFVKLSLTYTRLENAVGTEWHVQCSGLGAGLTYHLTAGIAHQNDGTIFFQQARSALVVVDSSVNESNSDVRIESIQFHRLKQPGNAGRSSDSASKGEFVILGRQFRRVVVNPAQAEVAVNFGVRSHRRFSHP